MKKLNLDGSTALQSLSIKEDKGIRYVWDPIRRKYVQLTKEEWVRQIFVLILGEYFSFSNMAVEKGIKVNQRQKRFDLMVFDQQLQALVLAEFKNPEIAITQHTFEQAARYNSVLKVPYLLVSNGLDHYFCKVNFKEMEFSFYEELPFTKINP